MLSATAIFAQFDTGKAQVCRTEMVVADQTMVEDKKAAMPGWSFWPLWLMQVLWALLWQVRAMRVVMNKIRAIIGAMRSDADTPAESSDARGVPSDKGVQVEVYDPDGMTVEGLKSLCERFGLRRSGLRGELIVRLLAELKDREARCA